MSESEYQTALSRFMSTKGITRCPTVCVVPTQASIADSDRAQLRNLFEERDAQRSAAIAHASQMRAERARLEYVRADYARA